MTDVQYWDDQLSAEIDEISNLLNRAASSTSDVDKRSKLEEAEKKLRSAQGTKRSFKVECRLVADPSERKQFETRLGRHEDTLGELQSDLNALKNEAKRGMLFDGAAGDGDELNAEASGDALINQMHGIQDKTQDSLDRTKQMVLESKEVGMGTLEELKRQREQMERIEEETMKIEDNLKRSEKLLKTFGRRMATDKFIMSCAVLNVCLMVVGMGTLEELKRQREQMERIEEETMKIEDNLKRSEKLLKTFGRRMATDKFIMSCAVLNVCLMVGVIVYSIVMKNQAKEAAKEGTPVKEEPKIPSPVRMLKGNDHTTDFIADDLDFVLMLVFASLNVGLSIHYVIAKYRVRRNRELPKEANNIVERADNNCFCRNFQGSVEYCP
eukprot:CAMPEP_0172519950 /NCGR_PEP_ID=MMETSP1066-20121228/291717_1 /TAXON_ID=671091 /ORGANISM="Coscinodiscus wailesii, Strain CCMP2513" /LENGTH=382 /DNA_ID=CAMNT_0013302625 /DNA_START=98 /DNA_END=1243 /DNA_ORIENTATION=+